MATLFREDRALQGTTHIPFKCSWGPSSQEGDCLVGLRIRLQERNSLAIPKTENRHSMFFYLRFCSRKQISKKGRFIEEIDIKSTQFEHSNRTSLNHQILFATTPLLSWNWRTSICCFEGKMPAKLHKLCDDSGLAA